MLDPRISLAEIEAVMRNMGYVFLEEREGLRFYSDGAGPPHLLGRQPNPDSG